MRTSVHSTYSAHREMLIEHLFIGEVLSHLWRSGVRDTEVLKPQVDDAGYDLAIECCGVLRHIQLKSAHSKSKTARVTVHEKLASKPSGCIIWIIFDEETMQLGPFRWFGGVPGSPLPDISQLKIAKHTKADSTGRKAERPNLRVVPKARFDEVSSIRLLVGRLFGSGLPEER